MSSVAQNLSDAPDWTVDPIIQMERDVLPVLHQVPLWCVAQALNIARPEIGPVLQCAEDAFRMRAAQLLSDHGIAVGIEDQTRFRETANLLRETHKRLLDVDSSPDGVELYTFLQGRFVLQVEATLDRFREIFLIRVLKSHIVQAEQAARAVGELNEIGRQFYYVALNASIEAARMGAGGRGFSIIGDEIRKMSKTAQQTAQTLQKLMVEEQDKA
ncbi:methyl-accepting chemotaxis protein [Pontivivens insulae]|uniref:Methyl-accepting chemotaxis protein 2 n=1 Tax=Pontivivens insulae TaxID=1639689 RepID=A0A2R8A9E5_9RHOB|nr:methyl-accepting chemotaxis protein [Pontivivens insulae]RED18760.1 methyl-accepting chemotaxis protein (MCP) signaling protein [Pontivivens insulae]SPF28658.1 Methyl-accepting chemotaxis protein 2 [Pontivivens insulae]